jgi:hypothetical protein
LNPACLPPGQSLPESQAEKRQPALAQAMSPGEKSNCGKRVKLVIIIESVVDVVERAFANIPWSGEPYEECHPVSVHSQ